MLLSIDYARSDEVFRLKVHEKLEKVFPVFVKQLKQKEREITEKEIKKRKEKEEEEEKQLLKRYEKQIEFN